ncbi:MAG: hypothetical protein Q4G42_05550, partial [Neisseria sp.]|nr:hypothetical protein [Neisseria sp.]
PVAKAAASTPKTAAKPVAKTATSAPKAAAQSTAKPASTRKQDSGSLSVRAQNKVTQITTASPKAQIREAIVLLCAVQEWTDVATLAEALKHKPDQLETLHLMPMVNGGQLRLRYPEEMTHPEQAYGLVKSA